MVAMTAQQSVGRMVEMMGVPTAELTVVPRAVSMAALLAGDWALQ